MNNFEYIRSKLPNIIRLDEVLDTHARATGFNLQGFNDAVVIRKKDLVCLVKDGLTRNSALEQLFSMLQSNTEYFDIITPIGFHSYHVKFLNNEINPFGDTSKNRLCVLSRSAYKGLAKFNA
jgi:hypothetical protein